VIGGSDYERRRGTFAYMYIHTVLHDTAPQNAAKVSPRPVSSLSAIVAIDAGALQAGDSTDCSERSGLAHDDALAASGRTLYVVPHQEGRIQAGAPISAALGEASFPNEALSRSQNRSVAA
jgi:hypothetical protein